MDGNDATCRGLFKQTSTNPTAAGRTPLAAPEEGVPQNKSGHRSSWIALYDQSPHTPVAPLTTPSSNRKDGLSWRIMP